MTAHTAPVPRLPMLAIATIMSGTLLCAAAARIAGFTGHAAIAAPPLASATLSFTDGAAGTVVVSSAATHRLVATIAPRAGGFLRSTMRVLATERAADHIGPAAPFALAAYPAGRLILTDTATGQALELEAFGPSNAAEFAALLPARLPGSVQ